MKTQEIISKLHEIKNLSKKDKELIYKAQERLADQGNKISKLKRVIT